VLLDFDSNKLHRPTGNIVKHTLAMTRNELPQLGAVALACVGGVCGGYPFALHLQPAPIRLEWMGNEGQVHPGEGAT
jgi:hypothetical protein